MSEPTSAATAVLDRYYLEMRWRVLSLAADLDRVERASGPAMMTADVRLRALREAIAVLHDGQPGIQRAEQVQMIFSDR